MKTITDELRNHLAGELTTLAELVKITRSDGRVIAFTSHDNDITLGGVTYKADGAFTAGKLVNEAVLKTKNYDVAGMLDSALIDEDELKAGLYDHARVDVMVCNWADPSQGALQMRRGWLGEIAISGVQYMASLRGLSDLLTRKVGETYTPECRYDLGDGRCGVNLAAMTSYGSVSGIVDERRFTDVIRSEEAGYFTGAKLTWLSGANAGSCGEVCAWDSQTQTLTLWLPPNMPIALGDAYSVTAGCDKRFATCHARFGNGENYGGFPYLPGISKILQYPD